MDAFRRKLLRKLQKSIERERIAWEEWEKTLPPRFARLLNGDDDPPPFSGAPGLRQPVEKRRVKAISNAKGRG
jgi:hypothetical protein